MSPARTAGWLVVAGALTARGAAEGSPPSAPALPRLEPLAVGEVSVRVKGDDRRVGGLSGLAYRESDDRWFAVSDDKDAPRVYTLKVRLDPAARAVSAVVEAVADMPVPPADAESVALLGSESLVVGFERPPALRAFAPLPAGAVRGALAPGRAFPAPPHVAAGARVNRGFESVAVVDAPGGREVWAATESALTSDGEEATPRAGALCRVLVFNADTGALAREHIHRTLPTPPAIPLLPRYNSLAELAPVGGGRLLALERSFSPRSGYDGSLRLITPGNGETDVGPRPAPSLGEGLVVLRADTLSSVVALGASAAWNVEGMALGPSLDDPQGGRLLLLVSDDNFGSDGQPSNRLLAVRWLERPDR